MPAGMAEKVSANGLPKLAIEVWIRAETIVVIATERKTPPLSGKTHAAEQKLPAHIIGDIG